MGIGGIGIWQLVIILIIVLMLFGTKKLRNMGSDLGGALKGFKKAMRDDEEGKDADPEALEDGAEGQKTTQTKEQGPEQKSSTGPADSPSTASTTGSSSENR